VLEEFATIDEGENEIEFLGGLEGELEVNDKRVLDLGQNIPLRNRVLHFISLHNVGLLWANN